MPRPTKTFTELEPVTFPMAESAYYELLAAVILAKVSGSEVPMATSVIAVTASFKPTVQPRTVATSATTAVTEPINMSATLKAGQPFPQLVGGINAKRIFQNIVAKCTRASLRLGWETTIFSSSTTGLSIHAWTNWSPQLFFYFWAT